MNLKDLKLEESEIKILICDNYYNILLNLEEYVEDILDIGLLDFSKSVDVTNINNFEYLTIQMPVTDCVENISNRLKDINKNIKNETSYTKESLEIIHNDFNNLIKFYNLLKSFNKHNFSFTIVGLDNETVNTISDFKIKNLSLAIKKYKNKRDKYVNSNRKQDFINYINDILLNKENKNNIFEEITLDKDSISIINMENYKNIIKFDLHFVLSENQIFHTQKDIFLINLIETLEQYNIGWTDKDINIEEDLIVEEKTNKNIIKISFYKIFN